MQATIQGALGSTPLMLIQARMRNKTDFVQYEQWGNDILHATAFSIIISAPIGLLVIALLGPVWLKKVGYTSSSSCSYVSTCSCCIVACVARQATAPHCAASRTLWATQMRSRVLFWCVTHYHQNAWLADYPCQLTKRACIVQTMSRAEVLLHPRLARGTAARCSMCRLFPRQLPVCLCR